MGKEVNKLGALLIRQNREQRERTQALEDALKEGESDEDRASENQSSELQGD